MQASLISPSLKKHQSMKKKNQAVRDISKIVLLLMNFSTKELSNNRFVRTRLRKLAVRRSIKRTTWRPYWLEQMSFGRHNPEA